jgi:hypothetical protein
VEQEFTERLEKYFPSLFNLYLELYGARYDFFYQIADFYRIFEQYSVQTKKLLHGVSKVSRQGDVTIEPLDFLVFG